MFTFIILLFIFLYFKIARVYSKQESKSNIIYIQHGVVALCAFLVFSYAFSNFSWYVVLFMSLVSFIVAGLAITAVQIGIFVDGKPLFGVSSIFKYIYILTVLIVLSSVILLF